MRHCFSVKKANDDEGCFGTKGSLAIMVHHAQAFLPRDDAENGESDKMELLRTELTLATGAHLLVTCVIPSRTYFLQAPALARDPSAQTHCK
jgi:hypothetical protein